MKDGVSFSATIDPVQAERLFAWASEGASDRWAEDCRRAERAAALSGMDVLIDLGMFDLDWSPLFAAGSCVPVAWLHRRTAERRDGSDYPPDEALTD